MRLAILSDAPAFIARWTPLLAPRGTLNVQPCNAAAPAPAFDLVLLDLDCLPTPSPAAFAELRIAHSPARVILEGTQFDPQDEIAYLSRGASACCRSHMSAAEITRVVEAVLGGGVWISADAAPLVIQRLQNKTETARRLLPTDRPLPDLSLLTEREREVADRVGTGASNKEIARQLQITDRTVKAHLSAIFQKLGTKDRLQLAVVMMNAPLQIAPPQTTPAQDPTKAASTIGQ